MNAFQLVALPVVVGLAGLSALALVKGWTGRKEGPAWIGVWVAAGIAIARPGLTMDAAQAVGIDRGADLVLYCAVIGMLVGFFMVYTRLRRLRRDVTLLTRHLAIRDAAGGNAAAAPDKPSRV